MITLGRSALGQSRACLSCSDILAVRTFVRHHDPNGATERKQGTPMSKNQIEAVTTVWIEGDRINLGVSGKHISGTSA